MRYAAALVLIVFAVGDVGATDDPAAECVDAFQREDYDAAVTPCTKAAEQGNASAQAFLGSMYANGEGVPLDNAMAVKWYTKAAEQGLALAQYDLGSMYDIGFGVPEDGAKAVEWFKKGAEQGDGTAQYFLGRMYFNGDGVPVDYVRAFMWFNVAAAQGQFFSAFNKDIVRKKMTPEQIAEAQRLSSEWFEKFKARQDRD